MINNPFTPTFGKTPLYLAGREDITSSISRALTEANNNPNLSTIFVGPRGTGKTVLLNYISDEALKKGWICINVTCEKGMLAEITSQTKKKAYEYLENSSNKKLTGLSIGQFFSIEWQYDKNDFTSSWRTIMTDIIETLNSHDIGLLFTVDEVNPKTDEMIKLSSIYQHFVRENRKVGLFMAGLPYQVSQLLQDETVSFLRRAKYWKLENIPEGECANTIEKTILNGGRTIESDALRYATKETGGFAYLLQLIGYNMFDINQERKEIILEDAKTAVKYAKREMEDRIYRTTYNELSSGDLQYLEAMLLDENESSTLEIAQRLKQNPGYASQYRSRLLAKGLIKPTKRGYVAFDLPGFKEFLIKEKDA